MELDHVVIVVRDLQRAVEDYQQLGFTVTPGGEHTDGRTHNALIPFADGVYLELIAFREGAGDHRWGRFAETDAGLVDWALRADDLVAHVGRLREAGLGYEHPRDGGRLRPDGEQLRWRGAMPPADQGLPFLIEDVTPRALRVPAGDETTHANGARAVTAIVIAVADLAEAAMRYGRLLDATPPAAAPDPLLAATTISFPCGAAAVTLTSAPAGPIHEHVQRVGPGPYALHLRTDDERLGWLDQRLAHGAALRLQPD